MFGFFFLKYSEVVKERQIVLKGVCSFEISDGKAGFF